MDTNLETQMRKEFNKVYSELRDLVNKYSSEINLASFDLKDMTLGEQYKLLMSQKSVAAANAALYALGQAI